MQMPGRDTVIKGSYRYGFNGKEIDNETYGQGNEYDYGMRVYDPRAGRFLSIDPLQKQYPQLTPYQFAGNNPIAGTDLDGREFFGAGWLVDKVSQGASKLGLTRTAGFISSYGHSLLLDPLYSSVNVVKSAKQGDVKAVAMQMDPTPVSGTISLYQTGKAALAGDKFAQGEFLGSIPAIIGGIKTYKVATLEAKTETPTTVKGTNEQVTSANGGNVNAAENNAATTKKPSQLEINNANSVVSEEMVYKNLESTLGKDEAILRKPRIYIGDGSSGAYAVPDFVIYNTKTGQFSKIVDAKDGGGKLSIRQKELNEQGGTFRGSSRASNAKPQKVSPNSIDVEKTNVNSSN